MRCHRLFTLLFALTLSWSHHACAAPLTLTPVAYNVTLAPGAGWDAMGTITNLSGNDLLSTEIFLEFSAYPHAVLAPRQRLGGIEFTIGNRTISEVTALFHVDILPEAVGGTRYWLDVFALDVHGNVSEPATYAFLVEAPAVVPEPSTVSLLAAALLAAAGLARHRARGG
ncbi:PEP-CTERM sorting domain-containing protein [Massilia atriviolacea]|uniref:PEP-CTERM sorting domain-containing protein n=1 Tax=Massilia atriviolacea TaxID=2495579 RepID=A0A430HIQ3_9BURK|nr:PEP-CTERM sorting domain-containing protein [Massilia atriviolacea]RSZ57369.1 PEP-CTERM sorting domain-containing protein [Massilia atriviolacea]